MCMVKVYGTLTYPYGKEGFAEADRKSLPTCEQSVLVYGSETWAMKAEDMHRLERTERMMIRWICGVRLSDKKARVRNC